MIVWWLAACLGGPASGIQIGQTDSGVLIESGDTGDTPADSSDTG